MNLYTFADDDVVVERNVLFKDSHNNDLAVLPDDRQRLFQDAGAAGILAHAGAIVDNIDTACGSTQEVFTDQLVTRQDFGQGAVADIDDLICPEFRGFSQAFIGQVDDDNLGR